MVPDSFNNGAHKPRFAVWPDDSVLRLNRCGTRTDFAVDLQDLFPIFRVDTTQKSLKVRCSAIRQPKNPKHLLGPVDRVTFYVPFPTPDLGEMLRLHEPGLASPQPLFDQ